MFHRKNKISAHSTQTRHTSPPQVSAAASSAATLAFLNNQKSNPSLSAAAAAAALKRNPHPPTDVSNVHTKRLQRRESGSSNGSPRPGLERRTSLTERSLRSPSPGRDGGIGQDVNAPPLPPLPTGVERTASGRDRAASLEAPLRISSPPPLQPGGRGVSLDRASRNPAIPKTAQVGKPKLSQLSEHSELQQRTSVNFSRPMSPPPQSPSSPVSPASGQTGWFAGPVVSGGQPRQSLDSLRPKELTSLPVYEMSGIQAGLQGVADKPVKKKKKRLLGGGNQSTHLSQGTIRPTGTAVAHAREVAQLAQEPEAPSTPSYTASESGRSSIDSGNESSSAERPEQFKTRAGALLARQPSLIDEAPEYEQQTERANTGRKVEALPQKSALGGSRVAAASSPEPAPASQLASSIAPIESFEPSDAVVHRTSSMSPPRAARFSPKPEFLGGIPHQPPGRAISPAKSALKHSPSSSVRTASPDIRFSAPSSEVGESGASVSRKKGNRVSFDETPIIVSGLQTSRYASQPPPRTGGIDDDLEDIMKPRPALPSFGSVRGRRADEKAESPTRSAQPIGHSSDHVVAGILSQDFASKGFTSQTQPKDEATTKSTHDSSLPLPPDVTSVEGTGYVSDSESEYSERRSHNQTLLNGKVNSLAQQPETIADAVTAIQAPEIKAFPEVDGSEPEKSSLKLAVASQASESTEGLLAANTALHLIAVQPATPAAKEEKKDLVMPGSYPGACDDDEPENTPAQAFTPAAVPDIHALPAQTSRQTDKIPATLRIEDDTDTESDTSSIWSDAEEDLPSGPGGFTSLNAILDRPATAQPPGLTLSKYAPAQSLGSTAEEAPPSPTAAHWGDATAYWRGLSEQKKRDLETQAVLKDSGVIQNEFEDSSDEDDLEKPPAVHTPRPATPPQKLEKKVPMLESPIVFASAQPAVVPKSKKEPTLKTSMRQGTSPPMSDDEAPRIKKTMRGSMRDSTDTSKTSGEHRFRSSMRNSAPRPDSSRRHSSGLEESKWSQETQANTLLNGRPRTAGGPPSPSKSTPKITSRPATLALTLRRQSSDDSVSSFRRQRSNTRPRSDGIVNIRRSMRDAAPAPGRVEQRPQSPPEKQRNSGRFSMRSFSPDGRQAEPPHMRTSMRTGSPDAGAPSLRNQELPKIKKSRFKSPTRLGFGKSKQKVPEAPSAAPPPAAAPPAYRSRISADSDDEDEPRRTFVSRFADSDDELESPEPPQDLTPVRGIPRRADDDDHDSTDLEDSDIERPLRNNIPPVPSTKDIDFIHGEGSLPNGKRPESILSAGSLRKGNAGLDTSKHAPFERPQQKRRLSWLSMGSKKRSSSVPSLAMASPPPSRGNDGNKPNLLRRSTPTGLPTLSEDATTNWPLAGEDERPITADGPGTKLRQGTMRPDVGKRRSTADYVGVERIAVEGSVDGTPTKKRVGFKFESSEPVYSMRTGRKKKFGTLRKMFGLHD